jgi:hypothetical protein
MAITYKTRPVTITRTSGGSATLTEETGTTDAGVIVTVKTVTDDGAGNLAAALGTVDYSGKTASLKVVDFSRSTQAYKSDYEDAEEFSTVAGDGGGSSGGATRKGGSYGTTSIGEEVFAGSSMVARYRVGASSPTSHGMTFTPPPVVIDLTPYTADQIVPGSVQFQWMGTVYQDFEGVLYRGRTDTDPGIASGRIDYAAGHALMTDYVVGGSGPTDFTLQSLWTQNAPWSTASLFFCTEAAPLRAGAGGFVLTVVDTQGNTLTANVDALGNITGAHMWGKIEFARGQVELQFGDFVDDTSLTAADKAEWWYSAADVGAVQAAKIWRPWPVDPTTLRYSCISYIYLPVDVSLMGIDPAALPPDGRVAFARPGDTCVVGVTHGASAFAPSLITYNTGHERLSLVQVLDAATGAEIFDGYSADLDAGTVTFEDISGYPASIKVVARTEVYRQIAEVRIDGSVRLTQPIGTAFDTSAVLSTALRQGDRFARVPRVYDQQTWNGVTWADGLQGNAAVGSYNTIDFPVEINNRGALTERWALRLRADATTFDLIGQHLGQIASGTINADFSPMNTARGVPYFTLRSAGWGSGWVAGNVLFIDTIGAEFPIDIVRTVQPGAPAGVDDRFWLVQRGDVGRPPEAP